MTSAGEPKAADPLLGRVVLGRYRIMRELARGGMGAIYLARSEGAASFVKPVVVKSMLPELVGDEAAARMFKREARIMSLLRHPGIVSVFDFGREEQSYLLVMDYVHGFHLGRWASWTLQKRGDVPVVLAVQIVVQVLEALQYAHTLVGEGGEPLRIVHRDVSPSNVLLDTDGHVRLADFGIAQSGVDAPDVKTATRTVKGKFSYMAPEILEGADPSPSSDAYAAAVVLHEILVGRNEFRTSSPTSTVGRVLTHTPTRLDEVRPDCSPELADVVEIALLKDPRKRYESAGDLLKALRGVRGMAAEDASALLTETFARDFRDPSLPSMFELPELDDLERAWRAPTPTVSSSPPAALRVEGEASEPSRPSDGPTRGGVKTRPKQPAMPAPPSSRVGLWIAASIGAIALGIGAAVWWSQPPPAPDVVYVEASPAGIEGAPTETPPTEAPPLETPPPTEATTPTEPETPREAATPTTERRRSVQRSAEPPDEAAAIQRAFATHTAEIRRCFASAPPDAAHDLVLRFSIDTSGSVQRVELAPAEVASTAPGQCVIQRARAIRFPTTSSPRSFRIPIEVRSR
ncbi:protein kinase domain-containing protein [Sandaracinus amylolyticus]|uniref:protein kinase domain-containing protein n=1 Tax=Sandaracinus amylolyticus TaxID=927083 RepID=UPI001F017D95|nr:protein kinase [Sandaracinus amylolyticus]UJR81190.1 Endo-1,4-beta-xylanase A [Sandaracinus amylolyticus]